MKILAKLNDTLRVHKKADDSTEFVTALEEIIHRLELISYTEIVESEIEENRVLERVSRDLRERISKEQHDKERTELMKLQLSILSMLKPKK